MDILSLSCVLVSYVLDLSARIMPLTLYKNFNYFALIPHEQKSEPLSLVVKCFFYVKRSFKNTQ